MAVISAGKGSSSAAGSMKYVEYEKNSSKPRVKYIEGIECSAYYQDAIEDFNHVRTVHNKHGGREAHHMVLAFSPDEEQRFSKAALFDKAVEVAKDAFPNHQVWLGMHDDTDHLHVHMIVNSVNLESGKKMQIAGRKGMHDLMERVQTKCTELGLDTGLEVGQRSQEQGRVSTHNIVEHKLIESGKSWKADVVEKVYTALQEAESKTDFILRCNERGLSCKWDDNRKNITFSYMDNPSKKVRNSNLAKTFTLDVLNTKESMQAVFQLNKERNLEMQAEKQQELQHNRSLERTKSNELIRERSIGLER